MEILTKEALRAALEKSLSYREQRVPELRYGLGGEAPVRARRGGTPVSVSRERIRQIET